MAGGFDFRDVHRQRLRDTAIRLLERERDRRLVVLAARRERIGPRSPRAEARSPRAEARLSKQRLEEVAEIPRPAGACSMAAEAEALFPVRRRPELLAGAPLRDE